MVLERGYSYANITSVKFYKYSLLFRFYDQIVETAIMNDNRTTGYTDFTDEIFPQLANHNHRHIHVMSECDLN